MTETRDPEPGRCFGQCCRSFRLGASPEQIRRMRTRGELSADEFEVVTMVIPLGFFARGAVLPTGELSSGGYYYDCRHLRRNGDCGIYEDRPKMCRNYPNGAACSRVGCTYTQACQPTSTTATSAP